MKYVWRFSVIQGQRICWGSTRLVPLKRLASSALSSYVRWPSWESHTNKSCSSHSCRNVWHSGFKSSTSPSQFLSLWRTFQTVGGPIPVSSVCPIPSALAADTEYQEHWSSNPIRRKRGSVALWGVSMSSLQVCTADSNSEFAEIKTR